MCLAALLGCRGTIQKVLPRVRAYLHTPIGKTVSPSPHTITHTKQETVSSWYKLQNVTICPLVDLSLTTGMPTYFVTSLILRKETGAGACSRGSDVCGLIKCKHHIARVFYFVQSTCSWSLYALNTSVAHYYSLLISHLLMPVYLFLFFFFVPLPLLHVLYGPDLNYRYDIVSCRQILSQSLRHWIVQVLCLSVFFVFFWNLISAIRKFLNQNI